MVQSVLSEPEPGDVVQTMHELFDRWEVELDQEVERYAWVCARVLVHEWVANLVQHADFIGRGPSITIRVLPDTDRLYCVVQDNSRGFDLDAHLRGSLEQVRRCLPERGMGLLMLFGGTEQLRYTRAGPEQQNTLRFCISARSFFRADAA